MLQNFIFCVAVMLLKSILCFNAEIIINFTFKIGKNRITALVKKLKSAVNF